MLRIAPGALGLGYMVNPANGYLIKKPALRSRRALMLRARRLGMMRRRPVRRTPAQSAARKLSASVNHRGNSIRRS
jgi:hypothetical protein